MLAAAHRGVREGLRAGRLREPLRLDGDLHLLGAPRRPRSSPAAPGRPGIHSALRVVVASTERRVGPDELVPAGEKGEIIASLDSRRGLRRLLEPAGRRRPGPARRLVLHRRHGLPRRRRRAVRGRPRGRHDHQRGREHPSRRGGGGARAPSRRARRGGGRRARRAWGERVVAFVVPAAAGLTRRGARPPLPRAARAAPASSGRAASSSSTRSPRPRPARSCAACSATATTRRSRHERVPAGRARGARWRRCGSIASPR